MLKDIVKAFFVNNSLYKKEFKFDTNYQNIKRILILAIIVFFLELINLSTLIFLKEYGYWGKYPPYANIFKFILFFTLFTIVYICVLYWNYKDALNKNLTFIKVYVHSFIVFLLAVGVVVSILQQQVNEGIIYYPLLLFAVASTIILKFRERLLYFGGSWIVLVIGLFIFQDELNLILYNIVNSFIIAILAFFLSQFIYTYALKIFENKLIIKKNKEEIEKLTSDMDEKVQKTIFDLQETNKTLNEELKAHIQIEEELSMANKELDGFVYKASHDLRAPLNSLAGLLDLAKREYNNPERVKEYLEHGIKSTQRLEGLIRDLIDFSKNKKLDGNISNIDFDELVNSIINDLKFYENAFRLEYNINVHGREEFHANLPRLTILFQNLITNSIKYQRFDEPFPYLNIDVTVDTEKAIVVFEDNGRGIPKDFLDKIFNMFFKISSKQEDSTGIGLFIVKQTIDRLEGSIEVESEVNVGTTFKITIPNKISVGQVV